MSGEQIKMSQERFDKFKSDVKAFTAQLEALRKDENRLIEQLDLEKVFDVMTRETTFDSKIKATLDELQEVLPRYTTAIQRMQQSIDQATIK